nr:hypothetical protein [bacterium]
MRIDYDHMLRRQIHIDCGQQLGPFDTGRLCIGQGGINHLPLPPVVCTGLKALDKPLIRIFLQEFFFINPKEGVMDFTRLDAYMDALEKTGAHVVASINLKPHTLYPQLDERIWQPTDWAAWQQLIMALVRRYGVERHLVTHWEIANEPDIGETGGCPYLMDNIEDYYTYYRYTADAVLAACPQARVGGPAVADFNSPLIEGLIARCAQDGYPLHFLTWHLYSDDTARHADYAHRARRMLDAYGLRGTQTMVTECAKAFNQTSIEEQALQSWCAVSNTRMALAYMDSPLDYCFYYHAWDPYIIHQDFHRFFVRTAYMAEYWNETPLRCGLFSIEGRVRPSFFAYQLMGRMAGKRLALSGDTGDMVCVATRTAQGVAVLMVNGTPEGSRDVIADLRLEGLTPGHKRVTTWRVDDKHLWQEDNLTLIPVEDRPVDAFSTFHALALCPEDSITLLMIRDMA